MIKPPTSQTPEVGVTHKRLESEAETPPSSEAGASNEAAAFLTLSAMHGIGHKTLFEFAETGQKFSDVLAQGPHPRAGHRRVTEAIANWSTLRDEGLERSLKLQALFHRLRVEIILRSDQRFPQHLFDLPRPPHWLFVQGSTSPLREASITIVGTRKPTRDGLFLASYVGACLGDWAAPTVSGLAAGIDQLAHEHSLRSSVPTVAVLGTGMLEDYPKGSAQLRERILVGGGCIVTEYLPNASYSAENFVQRNRLQAALGRVLVPVEWERSSGTAHTVRFAAELGRPIACLKLPHWPPARVQLDPGMGLETGAIFTVPRDQECFSRFVANALEEKRDE